MGAAASEARAASLLAGLDFSAPMQGMPTRDLSGGWRMRVSLACALFVGMTPMTVLMLDEPTNHLDLRTLAWLEKTLAEFPEHSSLVVVSHDRRFLDTICSDIIHLTTQQLRYYRGNYTSFEEQRMER